MKIFLRKCLYILVKIISALVNLPGAGLRFFFSCRLPARLAIAIIFLVIISMTISLASVYLMFRRHVSVPFQAMGLSEDYRPGFLLDADYVRRMKRGLRGQKEKDNDPWEKDYPLWKDEELVIDAEPEAIPPFRALQKYLQFCQLDSEIKSLNAYLNNSEFFYDYAAMPEPARNSLDAKVMDLLDLKWEDFLDLINLNADEKKRIFSDSVIGTDKFPDFPTVAMYLAWKKTQNPGFDAGKAFAGLMLYKPLMTTLLPQNVGQALHNGALIHYSIHLLCKNGSLNLQDAMQILNAIDSVSDRTLNMTSSETVLRMVNEAKTRMLYLYRLSPFGAWLLTSIYPDPVEVCRQRSRLFTITPTVAAEKTFQELPYDFLNMFDNRYQNPAVELLEEARMVFEEKVFRTILQQELSQIAQLDSQFPDPYTGRPLCRGERNGRPVFYSCGPNQKDDGMTADDLFYAK